MPDEKEETIEHPEPDEHHAVPEDDKHRYPKRHRSAPIRYGIDEYVDAAFLGATN